MKQSVNAMNSGNWKKLYHIGTSDVLEYSKEYPLTSAKKNGTVQMAITGSASFVCRISWRIWFFRNLGWLNVRLSKMKM